MSPTLLRNTVRHGDCVKILRRMPAELMDLVLTDPPYLCRYVDRSGRRVANNRYESKVLAVTLVARCLLARGCPPRRAELCRL